MTMLNVDKEAQKIVDLLEKKHKGHNFGWQVLSTGNLIAHCPLTDNHKNNDKNKSFSVFKGEDGNWHWHCFTCNYSGPLRKDINPLESDIEILVDDLKTQIEKQYQSGYRYLSRRIDENYLVESETLLFDVFEVGYYFFEPKFTWDFSRKFKDSVSRVPILWERSNHEWLVFPHRDLHDGSIERLRFRNIWVKKGTPEWNSVGIKTVKFEREGEKKRNSIPIFGYKNLHTDAPMLFIVEGEFDAITLTLATCGLYPAIALGSVSNFTAEKIAEIAKIAKGKAIVILPDWDTAGEQALERLTDTIDHKFLEKHKLFSIPQAPDKNIKDIDEFLRENYDTALEKVELLLENAVSLVDLKKQKEEGKKKEQEEKLKEYPIVVQGLINNNHIVNINEEFENVGLESINENIVKKDTILRGLRKGEVGFLVSKGETGKSFFSLYLSVLLASRIKNLTDPFICKQKSYKKVLYLNCEDPVDIFKEREKDIVSKIAESFADQYTKEEIFSSFKDNLIIKRPAKSKIFDLFKEEQSNLIVNRDNFKKIEALIKLYAVDLLIVDTWSKIAYLNENFNHTVSLALAELQNFASELDVSLLVLHHTSKSANLNGLIGTDAVRGATALYNNVRYVIQMQKIYRKGNEKEIRKELQKFGNDELVDFYTNELNEQEKKNAILVYEGKFNFGNKIAYIYVRNSKDGTLFLAHEKPFEIFI